ncbi:AAA family ATPase [Streptomyces europaeiscabiei]|uniref:AAA family ATPase n=1 Tax=Streptomyces europaeiscabiei TaxID=146819 RepID=UPI0038F7F7A8
MKRRWRRASWPSSFDGVEDALAGKGGTVVTGTGDAAAHGGSIANTGLMVIRVNGATIRVPAEVDPALEGLQAASPVFTGREANVAEVLAMLKPRRRSRSPRVVIAGMAGVGKTELALQLARQALSRGWFPGGVLFRDLHGYDPAQRVAPVVALTRMLEGLGIPRSVLPDDLEGCQRSYRSVLASYARRGRRILVVIDNTASEELTKQLIPSDAFAAVLITSGHTLAVGARLQLLSPLTPDAAVALIAETLRQAHGAGDCRVQQEPEQVRQIAEMCGYLPFALGIAASLLADEPSRPASSLRDALSNVHHRLDRLKREDRAVRALLDLAYGNLPDSKTRLLHLIALNPGPDLSSESAAHVLGVGKHETESLLADLSRAHLIESAPFGRWRLHDLARIHAREQAVQNAMAVDLVDRLLGYYLDRATRAERYVLDRRDEQPRGFDSRDHALAWLKAERANLLAAVDLANTSGHHPVARDLAHTLTEFLSSHLHQEEWLLVAKRGVLGARRAGEQAGVARARVDLAYALRAAGRLDEAMAVAQRAAEHYAALWDPPGQAMALGALAAAQGDAGYQDEAIATSKRAVDLMRQGTSRHLVGVRLMDLGVSLSRARDYWQAIDALREASTILSATSRVVEAVAQHNLGKALAGVGRHVEAAERYRRAVVCCREAAVPWNLRIVGESLVKAASFLERDTTLPVDGAIAIYREAAALFDETWHLTPPDARAWRLHALALMALGRRKEAIAALKESRTLVRRPCDHGPRAKLSPQERLAEAKVFAVLLSWRMGWWLGRRTAARMRRAL